MRPRRFSTGFVVSCSALVVLSIAVSPTWTTERSPEPAGAPAIVPSTPAAAVIPPATAQPRLERRAERTQMLAGSRRMPRLAPAKLEKAPAEPRSVSETPVALAGSVDATHPDGKTPEPDTGRIQRFEICRAGQGRALTAADALQGCIDHAPAFSSVDILPGTYLLDKQIVISKPLTIRTAGSAGSSFSCVATPDRCAILMAAPDLLDAYGLLFIWSTRNVTLEHVVLDGNRISRLASIAARWCLDGNTSVGFNAGVLDCLSCGLDDVVSRNALCGTGMVWSGSQALIERSAFRANGDATTSRMWADGLTVLYAPYSQIRQNQFVDNSDVALIIGYGVRSRIEQNIVLQRTQSAFAGLMLDNFDSDDLSFRGDFREAVIADNTVDCGPLLCVFGIQVGPRPWDHRQNIVGGDLHGNTIRGAKVGINVDGAGTFRAPTRIFANVVSDVPARSYFSGCSRAIPTDWMNVAPTSVVDRHHEFLPTGANLSDSCQLWSDLAPDEHMEDNGAPAQGPDRRQR